MRTISPCFHILRFPFAILWRYANAEVLPGLARADNSDFCVTRITNRTFATPYDSTPFRSHARSRSIEAYSIVASVEAWSSSREAVKSQQFFSVFLQAGGRLGVLRLIGFKEPVECLLGVCFSFGPHRLA